MKVEVDLNKCIGCRACELACSSRYEKSFMPNKSRIHIRDIIPTDEEISKAPMFVTYTCQQCDNAPCVSNCPTEALKMDPEIKIVKVDEDKCVGCGKCAEMCPHNAIWVDPVKKKAFKCEVCGGITSPACVELCPRNCISIQG